VAIVVEILPLLLLLLLPLLPLLPLQGSRQVVLLFATSNYFNHCLMLDS
jgi:hypothetical protein